MSYTSGVGRGRAELDRRARYKGHYRQLHQVGLGRGASPLGMEGSADPNSGLAQTPKGHGNVRDPRRLLEGGSRSEPVPEGLKLYDSGEEGWMDSSGDEEQGRKEPEADKESQDLDREILEAQKRIRELEESQKLKQKRKQLQDLQDRIQQLQEQEKEDSHPKPRPSRERTCAGDLTDWLLDEEARPPATGRRKYAGSQGDIDWQASSDENSDTEDREKGPSRSKIKSGMVARQTDRVVRPQLWAHAEIMEELGGKNITFQELNFRQFVAGELEIVMEGNISRTEKRSRCELLRLMCYLHGIHDWRTVKGVYAYILAKIEKGRLHWGDNIASEVQWALARRGTNTTTTGQTKKKGGAMGADKTWFCQAYQRGLCSKTGAHEATVNGKAVTVQHVCARCLQRDKTKAEHPEKDCTA